jgi:hypothetical protein
MAAAVHQRPVNQLQLDTEVMVKQVQLLELALPELAVAVAVAETMWHSHKIMEVPAVAEKAAVTFQVKLELLVQIS